MVDKKNVILGSVAVLIIIVTVFSLLVYFNMEKADYEKEVETLNLTYSGDLSSETSYLERNNKYEEAKIKTEGEVNIDLSQFLAQTATTSCILYQKIYFEDEEINLSDIYSEEEKEYLNEIDEFIGEYTIKEVLIEVYTTSGKEGFICSLIGKDKTENTVFLIDNDLRYTLSLSEAEKQYLN